MTHSAALEKNEQSLQASACTGLLDLVDSRPDEIHEQGRTLKRTVHIYKCRSCGRIVSMAAGKALNDYLPTSSMLTELAKSFTMRG